MTYRLEIFFFFFFLFFWGGDILIIKIKIKCPAGQNLEMTFIYLKISVFEFFFLNCHIFWCFYLWRVLSVIINPPSLWLFDFVPLHTLIPPFISGKLTWPQKILKVSSDSPLLFLGGWCHGGGIVIYSNFKD